VGTKEEVFSSGPGEVIKSKKTKKLRGKKQIPKAQGQQGTAQQPTIQEPVSVQPLKAIPTEQVVVERPKGAIPTGIEMATENQSSTLFVAPPPVMKDPLMERKEMVDKMSKEIFDKIAAKVLERR